ncbi:MAG: NYN domain-containing protein [Acidimicrobiales bacterium]
MRWYVDASNVMGSRPDGWWRDRDRALQRLLDEVIRWRSAVGEPVDLVIDGYPTPRVPDGLLYAVDIRHAHSRARDAADDLIVRLVRSEVAEGVSRRGDVCVVTSDRDLRTRVSALGARVEGARAFLDRLADIPDRVDDRRVLAAFGIDETALLGRGGEARVYAMDGDRVLRLPHPGVSDGALDQRRALLASIANPAIVPTPDVIEHRQIGGRTVIIERRLRGTSALDGLASKGVDRDVLIRHHLDVADSIADLPCPIEEFGEVFSGHGARADSFREWSVARLAGSLKSAGGRFADELDAASLTDDLLRALPGEGPNRVAPVLVHLDAYLGNMLCEGDRITALLDFGPMTIGGVRHLDPLVAIAYLAPEITPTATADDVETAHEWARQRGVAAAIEPAERWAAAYWSAIHDDHHLHRWCTRVLLD